MSLAPSTLPLADGRMGTFVAIDRAEYVAVLDSAAGVIHVTGRLHVDAGAIAVLPLFALLGRPARVSIDGRVCDAVPAAPVEHGGRVWAVSEAVAGRALVEAESRARDVGRQLAGGVDWHLEMNDTGRSAVYFDVLGASGFAHQQYPVRVRLSVAGSPKRHRLFTNGSVRRLGGDAWEVDFPSWFAPTCPFLHVLPEAAVRAAVRVSDGGVPITVCVPTDVDVDPVSVALETEDAVHALAGRFGPWPHDGCHISVRASGGMEYAGAFVASLRALRHELAHGYFGRGVLTGDGNSKWLDEAMATWCTHDPAPLDVETAVTEHDMGREEVWRRGHSGGGYNEGVHLIRVLDGALRAEGTSMVAFLRSWVARRVRTVARTGHFEVDLQSAMPNRAAWVAALFDRTVYGGHRGGGRGD